MPVEGDLGDILAKSGEEAAALSGVPTPSQKAAERFDMLLAGRPGNMTDRAATREASAALLQTIRWTPSRDIDRMNGQWRRAFADDFDRALREEGGGSRDPSAIARERQTGFGETAMDREAEFAVTASLYDLADAMNAVSRLSERSFPEFMNSESMTTNPIRAAFNAEPGAEGLTPAEAHKAKSAQWQAQFDRCLETTLLENLGKDGAMQRIKADPDALFNEALVLMSKDSRYSTSPLE